MYYWNGREARAERARTHTVAMAEKYGKEIADCIAATEIFGEFTPLSDADEYNGVSAELVKATTDEALFALKEGSRVAVLNFASYNNPGGKFIEGSSAQEESLCHVSFLYNVLSQKPEYYEWNNAHKNRGLYQNRALYSPDVVFERTENGIARKMKADVITCAAPNRSLLEKYGNFTEEENRRVLEERIKFIRDIALRKGVEDIILGAWGCGVFKQDPVFVAECFKRTFLGTDIHCIYAVPDQKTFDAFNRVFLDIEKEEDFER